MAAPSLLITLVLGGIAGLLAGYASRGLLDGWRSHRPDRLTWALAAVGAIILASHPLARRDPPHVAVLVGFVALLLLVSASDLRERAVYPFVVYPGVVAAIALAPWLGIWRIDALKGALAVAALFLVLYVVARLMSGPGALGAGDISVALLMGAIAGLSRIEPALILLGVSGGVMGLATALRARSLRTSFPYAPALCLGALAATLT